MIQSSSEEKWNSPGNAYVLNADTPKMKRPDMEFIWRLECEIAKEEIEIGAPHGTGVVRSVANILDGKMSGPGIEGVVLPGGTDWATCIEGTHSMHLDARYTVLTNDKCYIYVRAKGLYRPGSETDYSRSTAKNPHQSPPAVVTQDDVEFFSHLQLEAGRGRYNWLNGLVCIGVMSCVGTRIVIDAYYLTNFGGVRPESVMMRKD